MIIYIYDYTYDYIYDYIYIWLYIYDYVYNISYLTTHDDSLDWFLKRKSDPETIHHDSMGQSWRSNGDLLKTKSSIDRLGLRLDACCPSKSRQWNHQQTGSSSSRPLPWAEFGWPEPPNSVMSSRHRSPGLEMRCYTSWRRLEISSKALRLQVLSPRRNPLPTDQPNEDSHIFVYRPWSSKSSSGSTWFIDVSVLGPMGLPASHMDRARALWLKGLMAKGCCEEGVQLRHPAPPKGETS